MESKYDKYKKFLSEEEAPLPPEFAWEQMESGIQEKMEEIKSSAVDSASFASRFRKKHLWGLLLLLFLPWVCLWEGNKGNNKNIASTKIATDTPDHAQFVPEESWQDTQKEGRNPGERPVNTFDDATSKTWIKSASSLGKKTKSTDSLTPGEFDEEKNAPLVQESIPPATLEEPELTHQSLRIVPWLPSLKWSELTSDDSAFGRAASSSGPASDDDPLPSSPTKNDQRLSLLGGVNSWFMGFGPEQPARSAFESTLLSGSVGIDYELQLKRSFTLSAGLSYLRLENRFEWETAVQDQLVVLQDTIVEVQVSPITGHAREVRGDVALMAPAKRVIRHYNQTEILQVQAAIGKSLRRGRLEANLSLGGVVGFYSYHQGRTLIDGEPTFYQGQSTPHLRNRLHLSAMLSNRLSYALTDQFGVVTSLQYQQSLTDWSREASVSMRPGIFQLRVGGYYQW